ncbi:MAG TPA: cation diffusion facilitator family transporter [Polyangiaceae bacterium]
MLNSFPEVEPPKAAAADVSKERISQIVQSLLINVVIALAKTVAAVLTGSGALLAEAIHSSADCSNQILLLIGVRQGQKPPSKEYPLGHGREAYFWSFLVALLLFSLGGMFSIYEGVHKIVHPEPIELFGVGLGILFMSILLEGTAAVSNVREINRRRRQHHALLGTGTGAPLGSSGARTFFGYLKATKDSDLIVLLGENSAAVLGLAFAIAALLAAHFTGDSRWDAAGSIAIGTVLVVVAVFLAIEVKSLLLGERADEEIEHAVRELVRADGPIVELLSLITLQQGPGEVMLAAKIRIAQDLRGDDVAHAINQFERSVRARCPEVRWLFVEPDIEA